MCGEPAADHGPGSHSSLAHSLSGRNVEIDVKKRTLAVRQPERYPILQLHTKANS